jgi:hypothetical protein
MAYRRPTSSWCNRRMRGVLVLAGLMTACAPAKPEGSCQFWSDCGEGGACEYTAPVEVSRFDCSFADASCESGRRFGEFASSPRANECVEFSPAVGGLCDPAHDCGEGVDCQLGRCVNVKQIDATAEAFSGLCSDHLRTGGDIYLWGFALGVSENPLAVGVFFDAAPLTAFNAALMNPPAITNATQVTMGKDHVCAVGTTGDGTPFSACIGRDNPAVGTDPDGVPTLFGVDNPFGLHTQLSGATTHTCGIRDQNIDCWGADNAERQLDGTDDAGAVQATIMLPTQIAQVTTGKTFTCAGTSLAVFCWGGDHWAQGTFSADDGSVATVLGIEPAGEVTDLDAGDTHACAIVDTTLWCWGANDAGQVTGEISIQAQRASKPLGETPVKSVAVGRTHTCAVTAEHAVMCWGSNDVNQLGQDSSSRAPQVVPLDARAVGPIAAADDATCALLEDSFVHCWGTPQLTTAALPFPLTRFPVCLE